MSQWGFYFDQSRCLGCKTCMLACKNWNELRRGDNKINIRDMTQYEVGEGRKEKGNTYIDSTGQTNYKEFRKFYMKENWRKIETYESGVVLTNSDNTIKSTFDRRYVSISCNHCEKPKCVDACPAGNIVKDTDTGIVLAGKSCLSCGKCREACPWDAPQFYDEIGNYSLGDPDRPLMTKCTMCYDRINEGLKPACVAACWNRAMDAGPMDELKARYPKATQRINEFQDFGVGPNMIFKAK